MTDRPPEPRDPAAGHASTLFGVPMILVLPGAALLVVLLVVGLGLATGAFETPPQALPAAEGLEGSSPFKIADGDGDEDQ